MRLMRLNARAEHIPGKDIVVADTLSRKPMKVDGNTQKVMGTEEDIQAYVDSVIQSKANPKNLEEIKQATQTDSEIQVLVQLIEQGWRKYKKDTPREVQEFYGIHDKHISNGSLKRPPQKQTSSTPVIDRAQNHRERN